MLILPHPPKKIISSGIPTDGLLGEYLFEDNVLDTSGNTRNATAVNLPTYATGRVGSKCIVLNGVNQFVEFPILPAWQELNGVDFTCGVWAKTIDNSSGHHLIGTFATLTPTSPVPNQYWSMGGPDTSGDMLLDSRVANGARRWLTSPKYLTVTDGNWHFYIYEKSGLTVNHYVDNVLVGTATIASDGSTANNQQLRLGVIFARFLAVSVDALRFYDRVLTTEGRTALYNET